MGLALKLASQCLKCTQTDSYLAFSELEVRILVFVVSVNNSNNYITKLLSSFYQGNNSNTNINSLPLK